MSIASLTQRVRHEVKCYGLWRQTSIAKKGVAAYIASYLDETSKPDPGKKKAGYVSLQNGVMEPQVAGINYLTKEPQGTLRVFGFLRDDVARLGGNHAQLLGNDARVMASQKAWELRIAPHGDITKVGYKFVLSLDPRLCELITAAGHDADALLVHGARQVMRHLGSKYPDDRLGYLVGIHHDRKHIHGHILLFPFTEKGVPLRVSDGDGDKRFHELRREANKFVRQYFLKNFDHPLRASERPVDEVAQARVLARIVVGGLPPDLEGKPEALPWLADQKRQLQARPDHVLRAVLVGAYEKYLDHGPHWVKEARRNRHTLTDTLRAIARSQAELHEQLQTVGGAIKGAKSRLQQNWEGLAAAQEAVSHCRFYLAHARGGHGRVAFEAGTREQRKWLTDLFAHPARGAAAREALGNPLGEVVAGMHERGSLAGLLSSTLPADGSARRTSRDFLKTLFMARVDELDLERKTIRADLARAYQARAGILIKLDSGKVGKALLEAAGEGRLPPFLEQYAGLKRMEVDLPILCRSLSPEELVAQTFTEKPMPTFEALNQKIINTLRTFQGTQTKGDVFEVDRYFRAVTDATTAPEKKQVQAAVQAEVTQFLANPSVEDYLLTQNTNRKPEDKAATWQRVSRAVAEIDI